MRHAHTPLHHAFTPRRWTRRALAPLTAAVIGLATALTAGSLAHAAPTPTPSPTPQPTSVPTGGVNTPTTAPTSDPATSAPTPTGPAEPPRTTLEAALDRDLGLDRAGFIAASQRAARAAELTEQLHQIAGFNDVRLIGDQVTVTGQGAALRDAVNRIDPALPVRDQTPHPTLGEIHRAWTAEVGHAGLQSIAHTGDGVTITIAANTPTPPPSARKAHPADNPDPTTAEEFVAARPWATLQRSATPIESDSVVGAGNGLYLAGADGDPTWCTAGFAAQTADAAPALLTAGHCTHDGANTLIKSKPADTADDTVPVDDLGTLDFHQFGGPGNQPDDGLSDPGTDLALIALANQHTATTDLPSGGPAAHITGTVNPTLGAPVCTINRKSGWQCGTIDAPAVVYQTPGYTGPTDLRTIASFSFTNPTGTLTSVGGDSGAPIVTGDKAVGILTASSRTPGGAPVIYAVPASALAGAAPNTRLQTWVPQPVLTTAVQATTTDATAAWQPGQTVTGTIAASQGATNAGLTIDVTIDNAPAAPVTTDQNGQFTLTLPGTLTPPPARHAITFTAHRGADTSTPLTVFTPYLVSGPTATVWGTNGAATGVLGVPTSDEYCDLDNNGCFQHFTGGSIYRSANTPATAITGDFKDKFAALGWETSPLGYPNGPKTCGLVRGGCFQPFEKGALYWSPTTGVHYNVGSIRNKYGDTGWEHGFLGYPTTDQNCGKRDGGCVQDFEYGNIMWSPVVGAHYIRGAILARYSQLGYEFGALAYPTTDEICNQPNGQPLRFGGCFQDFQLDNASIYWSPQYGAHDIAGPAKSKWAETGYENGKLGYPVSDKACNGRDSGCYQNFDIDNATIYHQPNTSSAHYIRGAIKAKWATIGYEHGRLGYPTSDEICDLPYQGCRQEFERERGKITWQVSVGAHYLVGEIRAKWDQTTTANFDILSYPTTDEICGLKNNGCKQEFGKSTNATYRRTIWWTPNTGPHPVIAAGILNQYYNRSAENGTLGYPLNDTGTNSTGKWAQHFQGGWLETAQY